MTDIVVRLIDCHVFFWYNGVPQFLLLKRSENQIYPGIWQCVTGKIRKGEKPHETAKRELKEETGLIPKTIWTVDRVNNYYESENERMYLIPIFGVEVITKNVALSYEHQDYKWCNLDEGINLLLWTQQKEGLISFYKMLTTESSKLLFTKITL